MSHTIRITLEVDVEPEGGGADLDRAADHLVRRLLSEVGGTLPAGNPCFAYFDGVGPQAHITGTRVVEPSWFED